MFKNMLALLFFTSIGASAATWIDPMFESAPVHHPRVGCVMRPSIPAHRGLYTTHEIAENGWQSVGNPRHFYPLFHFHAENWTAGMPLEQACTIGMSISGDLNTRMNAFNRLSYAIASHVYHGAVAVDLTPDQYCSAVHLICAYANLLLWSDPVKTDVSGPNELLTRMNHFLVRQSVSVANAEDGVPVATSVRLVRPFLTYLNDLEIMLTCALEIQFTKLRAGAANSRDISVFDCLSQNQKRLERLQEMMALSQISEMEI